MVLDEDGVISDLSELKGIHYSNKALIETLRQNIWSQMAATSATSSVAAPNIPTVQSQRARHLIPGREPSKSTASSVYSQQSNQKVTSLDILPTTTTNTTSGNNNGNTEENFRPIKLPTDRAAVQSFRVFIKTLLSVGAGTSHSKEFKEILVNVSDKLLPALVSLGITDSGMIRQFFKVLRAKFLVLPIFGSNRRSSSAGAGKQSGKRRNSVISRTKLGKGKGKEVEGSLQSVNSENMPPGSPHVSPLDVPEDERPGNGTDSNLISAFTRLTDCVEYILVKISDRREEYVRSNPQPTQHGRTSSSVLPRNSGPVLLATS